MSAFRLPERFVARMLNGHAAIGLATAALLYVLCLSGTLMVFHQEFARWEQPDIPEFDRVDGAAAAAAAAAALQRAEGEPHDLFVRLPIAGMPRLAFGVDGEAWYADANGRPLGPKRHPWTDFIERLHYYLTLPSTAGIALVGFLGVLMTALVISGLLAHPRLFRDAFKLRLGRNRLIGQTDTHNRLGVWAAPFHLVIAFTGAALGLAVTVATAMATVGTAERPLAVFESIFGPEAVEDPRPAPLPDIARALDSFERRHPSLEPWFVSIHHPATRGQATDLLARHPRRLIYGETYQIDDDGRLIGNTGLSDGPIGQQAFASLYPLHFGTFGGLPVKLIYGVLGLLAGVMVASGGNVWLLKRRQRGRPAAVLERVWPAVVWGTPAALAATFTAACLGLGASNTLAGLFWGVLVVFLLAATLWRRVAPRPLLQLATGCLTMLGTLCGLVAPWPSMTPHAVGSSAVLLGIGAAFIVAARSRPRGSILPG